MHFDFFATRAETDHGPPHAVPFVHFQEFPADQQSVLGCNCTRLEPAGADAGVVQFSDNSVRKERYQFPGFRSRIFGRLQTVEQSADRAFSSAEEPFVGFQILRVK